MVSIGGVSYPQAQSTGAPSSPCQKGKWVPSRPERGRGGVRKTSPQPGPGLVRSRPEPGKKEGWWTAGLSRARLREGKASEPGRNNNSVAARSRLLYRHHHFCNPPKGERKRHEIDQASLRRNQRRLRAA